jgi:hypothetical protein
MVDGPDGIIRISPLGAADGPELVFVVLHEVFPNLNTTHIHLSVLALENGGNNEKRHGSKRQKILRQKTEEKMTIMNVFNQVA